MLSPINIQNPNQYPVEYRILETAIQVVLERHNQSADTEMSVLLADNQTIQQLNRQFRNIDAPTDVLSFPSAVLPDEIEEVPYLGDLVIAVPYAQTQADQEDVAFNHLLQLLVVHGTLHLLGYDHDKDENRQMMWAEQAQCLDQLQIDPSIVPSLEG